MKISVLTGEERRQLIDTQQVYQIYRQSAEEYRHRFRGSMRWVERGSGTYLLRKTGSSERSLGARSSETERAYAAFVAGRHETGERRDRLRRRLEDMAPVNVAMGLGRVPAIAARILRRFDEKGLLGEQVTVVGTNALYAYEARAGLRLSSDLVATRDIDFLLDTRRSLSLAVRNIGQSELIGLLRQADRTFATIRRRSFRAANSDGYLVDLIRPEPRDFLRDRSPTGLSGGPDDLEAAPIKGLDWLVNGPKTTVVAVDETGLPVHMAVIDPRVFALHKRWLSRREDRDPLKRDRDLDQARTAARIAVDYLRLPFDGHDLDALPKALRAGASELLAVEPGEDAVRW